MAYTLAALALLAGRASAQFVDTMNVGSCAELVAAAEATSTGDIIGQLAQEFITCDDWTTVEIQQNKLKLLGDLSRYTLTNVRFAVASDAVLRVEVPNGPVEFASTGETQEVSGGFLNVAAGGRARFLTTAVFMGEATVTTVSEDSMNHGGCIYNEGVLRFEGGFGASLCKVLSPDRSIVPGNGGALANGPGGLVVFKGFTSFEANGGETNGLDGRFTGAEETGAGNGRSSGLDGGAIYTEGKVSFFEDTEFISNEGDQGGAIFIADGGEVKFLKNAEAAFSENTSESSGGHVANYGSLVLRSTGMFEIGRAGGSGGAIFSSGVMLFVDDDVSFVDNTAGAHGGAIASDFSLIDFIPEDATYEGNSRTNADQDFECDNVYLNGSADGGEDGFTCIPGGPGSSYSA